MRKLILLVILSLVFFSSLVWKENKIGYLQEKIRFEFSAERIGRFKETIEVKASLYNDNSDTVYFLSSKCGGEQYSLCYDTIKFALVPLINCNANFPKVIKIAPHCQHHFFAYFRNLRDEKNIKLGFNFYSVGKSFDLNKITLCEIYNSAGDIRPILWADEKVIK